VNKIILFFMFQGLLLLITESKIEIENEIENRIELQAKFPQPGDGCLL